MTTQRRVLSVVAVAAMVCALLVACGDDGGTEATGPEPTIPSATEESESPTPEVVEGKYDVGGHELFIRCEGSGSPTVVYMHGSINEPGLVAHRNGTGIMRLLAEDYRTCVYDRRNVGDSDKVDAVQLPADATNEMRTLLSEAGIKPPYVLLGASFGGMLAYLYANEHPDQVVGMVLLDAMFPDELSLEHLFPPQDTFEAFSEDDEQNGLERISHFKVITAGQKFIGKEPAIPMTYLASDSEGYEDFDPANKEYTRQVLKAQAAYVDRFSPGVRIVVDAPHFMEPVIPQEIADAVRDVIAKAG